MPHGPANVRPALEHSVRASLLRTAARRSEMAGPPSESNGRRARNARVTATSAGNSDNPAEPGNTRQQVSVNATVAAPIAVNRLSLLPMRISCRPTPRLHRSSHRSRGSTSREAARFSAFGESWSQTQAWFSPRVQARSTPSKVNQSGRLPASRWVRARSVLHECATLCCPFSREPRATNRGHECAEGPRANGRRTRYDPRWIFDAAPHCSARFLAKSRAGAVRSRHHSRVPWGRAMQTRCDP